MTKYPDITIPLSEIEDNAYSVLAACNKAMRRAEISKEEISSFDTDAQADDYEHLIVTVYAWFNVE
jgi:hypothetical protein